MTKEMLAGKKGNFNVIFDVSHDPFGEYNPLPIYSEQTDFDGTSIILENSSNIGLILIDHLPSMLPKESSKDFCDQLISTLKDTNALDKGVWGRTEHTFLEISASLWFMIKVLYNLCAASR